MKYCCLSDKGLVRERNEDSYSVIENDNSDILLFVCDGIGGNNAGDIASSEVKKTINNLFKTAKPFRSVKDIKNFLTMAINEANNVLLNLSSEFAEYHGLGTTITGVLVSKKNSYSFNVGDSRVYGIKEDLIKQLTRDDSLVNLLVDDGQITKEEAKTHPKRSHLVKAIGIAQYLDVPVSKIDNFDYYVICSDGLYSLIEEDKMKKILLAKKGSLENKTRKLVNEALLHGGYDNITVIVVQTNGK